MMTCDGCMDNTLGDCVCGGVIGMVQPQPDGPMQWDVPGEESGGALRVPPELAANEVVTRLLGDNQQLRGIVYSHCSGLFLWILFDLLSRGRGVGLGVWGRARN